MDQQDRRAITRQGEAISRRLWLWDPLSLSPPEDEYDRLAWPLLRMLRDRTPADEITLWLDDSLFHFYDPEPDSTAPGHSSVSAEFVAATITWFAELESP